MIFTYFIAWHKQKIYIGIKICFELLILFVYKPLKNKVKKFWLTHLMKLICQVIWTKKPGLQGCLDQSF